MTQKTMSLGGGFPVVHLTYRPGDAPTAEYVIACMDGVTNFATSAHQPNYLRSNDTRAVTCKQCAASPAFQLIKSRER